MAADLTRRHFLTVLGAGAGAAGLAACSHHPASPDKLIPYLIPPENLVPGLPQFYRSVCRECAAGCGVTARTREGRVVKLEGNPEDPIGRGALCARGQASLQSLYAPERLRVPMQRGANGFEPISWDAATAALAAALEGARAKGGGGVRLWTRPEPGSAGVLQRAIMTGLGAAPAQRIVMDPRDLPALRAASAALFGRNEQPAHELAAARSVVAFGADFLETWQSPVELTRGFAAGRGRVGETRTRLTWIGPRLGLTGASADTWLRARAGGELAVALGLLRWLTDPVNGVTDLAPEAPAVAALLTGIDAATVERTSGVPWASVAALGHELSARRPSALLGPGLAATGADSRELAIAVALANHLLGNIGKTVLYGLDPMLDPATPFASLPPLLDELASGRVDLLLLHHADPVGELPAALGATARAALGHVPLIVSCSERLDPTTALAHLVLPVAHALEAFGDVSTRRGVVALAQPVMSPLFGSHGAEQVLLDAVARVPALAEKLALPTDFLDYTQKQTEPLATAAGGDAVEAARAAQQRGGYYSAALPEPVTLRLSELPPLALAPVAEGLALLLVPTTLRRSHGDAPWLREVPDALTGIAAITWVELAPAAAARIGVSDGDVVRIETASGSAELPALVRPGLRDDVVVVPLGGPEGLALVGTAGDRAGGLAWSGAAVRITKTGGKRTLPRVEEHPFPSGREVLRSVSSAHPGVPREPPPPGMAPGPEHTKHRWAMAIDLDRCTGCQSCVVACYAENNIGLMGAEQIAKGRSMAWLEIQRYVDHHADEVRVDFLPMLCQQCDDAPCETVCPVYATYHTSEGLNAQVYNRCVGTRYCSNNCPYKVRAFNWEDHQFDHPLDLQLNPDVSVRSKGVMEKCTFCVQRIRLAENTARDDGRRMVDGDVTPACAQTCPAQAISFGDALDPTSRVSVLANDGRAYHVLAELNTRPAVTYLARVREDKE